MDIIEFFTPNNEFKIRLTKQLKKFSMSRYTQYKITIDFLDTMNNIILSINTSEKNILQILHSIEQFCSNMGNILSDTIYFDNSDGLISYFIYMEIKDVYTKYIEVDEESLICFVIFEESINGKAARLYIEADFYRLEELTYYIHQLICDIPYLEEMNYNTMMEYMEYKSLSRPF